MIRDVIRYPIIWDGYRMEDALASVEAIGKQRTPRFVIDDENRFVYENMVRWVHGYSTMRCIDPRTKAEIRGRINRGIYIGGNTGTGKSLCIDVMLNYSRQIGAEYSTFDVWKGKLLWRTYRADEICDLYTKTGDITEVKLASVLAIQDMGSEPLEVSFMGNKICALEQILGSRGDRVDETLTLITSNFPIEDNDMKTRYGDRIVSRLIEMCNYFELTGKDRRTRL